MAHKQTLLLSLPLIMVTAAYGMDALLEKQKDDPVLPIVLVHGLANDSKSLNDTKALLEELAPGTKIFTPDIGFYGFAPCEEQVQELTNFITSQPDLKEGFNLIGYSLGGLIARCTLEEGRIPRACSLVTIASPHRGVCGFPGDWDEKADEQLEKYLKIKPLQGLEKLAHRVMYLSSPDLSFYKPAKDVVTKIPRLPVFSVVDIWNEPAQQARYLKYNQFLPLFNNEKKHRNDTTFRHNLTTALAFLALSGDKDTTVEPWQSTRFDYWNVDRSALVPLEDTSMYSELGLQELGSKLKRVTIEGATHGRIHMNRDTFVQHVLPALTRRSQQETDAGNVYEEASTSWWRKFICCK